MNSHPHLNEGLRIVDEFVCQAIPDPGILASLPLTVEVDWPGVSLKNLSDELVNLLPARHRTDVALCVERAKSKPDAPPQDSTIFDVTIQGGAPVFAAFIYAWLHLPMLPSPKNVSLVLMMLDGATFEIPADATLEEIAAVVSAAGSAEKIRMKMKTTLS